MGLIKRIKAKFRTPVDWNLDYEFIVWLNKWVKEYKKNASRVVDLEDKKFRYKGKKMTQLDVINRIIELTEYVKPKFFDWDDDIKEKVDEIFELFHGIFFTMWW